MKKRFKISYLLVLFYLLNNSVFASPALTMLKNNIESHPLYQDFLQTVNSIASNNGFTTNNFEIKHVPGHFVVKNKFTGKIYDSGDGRGGVIKQHFADCLLHSTDNLFYLESFNGKLPYSDFSAKMRESLDMTMFYSFIKLYAYLKNRAVTPGGSFLNFNAVSLNFSENGNPFLYLKNLALGTTIIPEILREAGIVTDNTRGEFMNMLRYIFTDMKNKMGLPGAFSFEEDTPHLLWVFRDALGYSEDRVKILLQNHFNRYRQKLIEIHNFVSKYNIIGYNDDCYGGYIIFSPKNLDYIESISSLYIFQEKNMQNNLIKISRTEANSNFSLDYGNGKLFNNNRLNYDLSFLYIGENEFNKNIKLGLLFGYEQSVISFSDYEIALKNIILGSTIKRLYNYDRKSNFNMGIIGNFKINNEDSIITKKNVGLNFKSDNITLFFQDYRNININSLILSEINFSTTFNYTNYFLRDIKFVGYGLSNYNIVDNNRYYLFSLNFELDFIKTFRFSKNIKSNIVLNTRSINYLNRPNNGFKLENIQYDYIYFKTDNIMKTRNNLWFNFKADIHFGKYVEISGIIGTNIMSKNDTFIGAGFMVKF